MGIRDSRALAGVALLLLMFALGLTLVTLFSRQPRQQAPPTSAQQPEPKSPSEVVRAYWRLSQEGDVAGANKYWSAGVIRAGLIKINPEGPRWAEIISEKRLMLAGIDTEFAEDDGTVSVVTKATAGSPPLNLKMKNTLTRVNGEWKITEITPADPTSARYTYLP